MINFPPPAFAGVGFKRLMIMEKRFLYYVLQNPEGAVSIVRAHSASDVSLFGLHFCDIRRAFFSLVEAYDCAEKFAPVSFLSNTKIISYKSVEDSL